MALRTMAAIPAAWEVVGVAADADGAPTEREDTPRARATISVPTIRKDLAARILWPPSRCWVLVKIFLHARGWPGRNKSPSPGPRNYNELNQVGSSITRLNICQSESTGRQWYNGQRCQGKRERNHRRPLAITRRCELAKLPRRGRPSLLLPSICFGTRVGQRQ